MRKRLFFCAICLALCGALFSQNAPNPALAALQEGVARFGQGKWQEALDILRPLTNELTGDVSKTVAGEALFWTGLACLSAGQYDAALADFLALEALDPESRRLTEAAYHKGRALFYLGRYDEAIVSLTFYADSFGEDASLAGQDVSKKTAALYWIGESLFAMGQFDFAEAAFSRIVTGFPRSAKYEASSYRIALISQKRVEAELLELLNWSHEESLQIMEEYQRRERAYDQAILSYQKRITDMLKDTRLADLEAANAQYQQQLAAAEERIRGLEARLEEATSLAASRSQPENPAERLEALRSSAEFIRGELELSLGIAGGAQ